MITPRRAAVLAALIAALAMYLTDKVLWKVFMEAVIWRTLGALPFVLISVLPPVMAGLSTSWLLRRSPWKTRLLVALTASAALFTESAWRRVQQQFDPLILQTGIGVVAYTAIQFAITSTVAMLLFGGKRNGRVEAPDANSPSCTR